MRLPGFTRITSIVTDEDAESLARWCARTELSAELRTLTANLETLVGWTHQEILLGAMLANAVKILERGEDTQ